MTAITSDTLIDAVIGAMIMVTVRANFWPVFWDMWNTMTDEAQSGEIDYWIEEIIQRNNDVLERRAKLAPAEKDDNAEDDEDEEEEEEAEADEEDAGDDEEEAEE